MKTPGPTIPQQHMSPKPKRRPCPVRGRPHRATQILRHGICGFRSGKVSRE
jgi:hypothetical protein